MSRLAAVVAVISGTCVLACGSPATPAAVPAQDVAAAGVAAADGATTDAAAGDSAVGDTTSPGDAATEVGAVADASPADAPDAGPAGAVPIEQLAQALATAVCNALVACPGSPLFAANFSTPAGCESFILSQALFSEVGFFVSKTKAGKIAYDATNAGKCIQLFATQCGSFGTAKPQGPCAATFKGNVATGTPCDVDEECSSGYCHEGADGCAKVCAAPSGLDGGCKTHDGCAGKLLCLNGKCTDKTTPGPGEPCSANGVPCGPGHGCFPKDSFDTCEPQTESGPCGENVNCKPGFFCNKGSCASNATAGKACGVGEGNCGPDFVCVQAFASGEPGKCGPVQPVGGVCNSVTECGFLDTVCAGASMDAKDGAKTGKCAAWPKKGEACSDQPGLSTLVFACEPPWQCHPQTKTCGEAFPDGFPCKQDGNCQAGLKCHAGICKPPLAKDAACQAFGGVPCQKGLSCTDGKCAVPVCK